MIISTGDHLPGLPIDLTGRIEGALVDVSMSQTVPSFTRSLDISGTLEGDAITGIFAYAESAGPSTSSGSADFTRQ